MAAALMAACTPVTPDVPDNPDNTETPEGTDQPDNTEDPENPDNPNAPDNPEDNPEDNPAVPEEPKEAYYVKVAETYSDWSGDYLITYTSGSNVLVLSSYNDTKGYGTDISSKVTASGIHSDDGDTYKAVVEKSGTGYTINVTGIGYLGLESAKNSLNAEAIGLKATPQYSTRCLNCGRFAVPLPCLQTKEEMTCRPQKKICCMNWSTKLWIHHTNY